MGNGVMRDRMGEILLYSISGVVHPADPAVGESSPIMLIISVGTIFQWQTAMVVVVMLPSSEKCS